MPGSTSITHQKHAQKYGKTKTRVVMKSPQKVGTSANSKSQNWWQGYRRGAKYTRSKIQARIAASASSGDNAIGSLFGGFMNDVGAGGTAASQAAGIGNWLGNAASNTYGTAKDIAQHIQGDIHNVASFGGNTVNKTIDSVTSVAKSFVWPVVVGGVVLGMIIFFKPAPPVTVA